jgi:putative ABC transport system permease protein
MAQSSLKIAEKPLVIPGDEISSVMVKVAPGADPHKVSLQILQDVLGVVPIESPNLFGSFRQQMLGLLWGVLALLVMAWILALILIALVFSMAANERNREIAVLRAIGATRVYVFRSLVLEAGVLALTAGGAGVALAGFGIYVFKDYLAGYLRMPFLFPSGSSLAVLIVGALVLSILTVSISAMVPALRISRQEPAIAMRE